MTRRHGNARARAWCGTPRRAAARQGADTATQNDADTETRVSGPIVRLTIDLSEPTHTRFKTACVMTKRKMVDEVRSFIERRTAELEREAGRF